ncbi:RHS repeat domain-containing protein, partial [Planctomycetota bacterium]
QYGIEDNNEIFTMDDLGNRDNVNLRSGSNEDYVIDANTNRYTSVGGDSLTYDAAGNRTTDKDGYEYEYDYENRIVEVNDVSGTRVAEFSYDALGRRVEKKDLIDPNNTRRYYNNYNWQVLTEYDGADVFKQTYFYGNYIDEVLLSLVTGGNIYYYINDHLYSPVALVNYNPPYNVLERYEYDAYGNCTVLDQNFADNPNGLSDFNNFYLFTGRRLDILDNGSLKIQYNRNRYYDTHTGRWLTQDPAGYADSMNLYGYVKSNPAIHLDPFGLLSFGLGRIDWHLDHEGINCCPGGWAYFTTNMVSPPIGSLGTLTTTVDVFARVLWTNENKDECKHKWLPLSFGPVSKSKDLWPFSSAFISISGGLTAPDLSASFSFYADTYYISFFNAGIDSTLEGEVDVTYKKWVSKCYKCMNLEVEASVSAAQRSNLGGTATTLGAMGVVYAGATWGLPAFKTITQKLLEAASEVGKSFVKPWPAQ